MNPHNLFLKIDDAFLIFRDSRAQFANYHNDK